MSDNPKEIEFPWVEEVGGDELTTRTVTHYSPDEGSRRFIETHSPGFFWKNIEDNLLICREIMAEHGWPDARGTGFSFPSDGDVRAPAYSDLWYAGQVGSRCWLVLQHRETFIPEIAMARIMDIGSLCKEWEWRRRYKSNIVTDQEKKKRLNSGREYQNAKMVDQVIIRRKFIDDIMSNTRLKGGALEKYILKEVKKMFDEKISARTVRRDLFELRKPKQKLGHSG